MPQDPIPAKNRLYYGDNLAVLRGRDANGVPNIPDQSVDLIYLDPPFNSRQDYNVLFAEKDGARSSSQIAAFKDTWEWNEEASRSYHEVVQCGGRVAEVMLAFHKLLGGSDMLAYLAMMASRLTELRRVLKESGSIYLHCDPTASHYLKLLMDGVFGPQMFKTEIIWKRSSAHSDGKQGRKQHGRIHDILLFYTRGQDWKWNPVHTAYDEDYLSGFYKFVEEGTGRRYRLGDLTGPGGAAKGNPSYEVMGVTRFWRYSKRKMQQLIDEGRVVQSKPGAVPAYKRYLDEMEGVPLQDIWTDIPPIGPQAQERLGYPTQKPEALLERILRTSSNEGDMVLDPFCGCGTTVQVAQKLNRRWIGIDITHLAVGLIKGRLASSFGPAIRDTYAVFGEPKDLEGAKQLALDDRFGFENWALGLVYARKTEQRKGADRGIDGRKYFRDDGTDNTRQMLLSVKSGAVDVTMIRDLRGSMEREKAEFGIFITLAPPTKPMLREAADAGVYRSPLGGSFPRIQILTIDELLKGAAIDFKELYDVTYKRAPKNRPEPAVNLKLGLSEAED
jgi:DNA modification methylase